MRTLTPAERRAFRAKAHHLHPVVSVGHHGLTPAVLHEIDVNLLAHGLIKIRVFDDDRDAREALLLRICGDLDAAPVQHLGKTLTLWRPAPEPEKPKARPAAAKSKSRPGAPKAKVRSVAGKPKARSDNSWPNARTAATKPKSRAAIAWPREGSPAGKPKLRSGAPTSKARAAAARPAARPAPPSDARRRRRTTSK